ncbi:MAG: aldehyde dehydrogenase family protein [Thermodesulfovibrionales bacterium]|nr:aldehyde dehydrogenase family protein [Thermodesulfovibrionales bacterium]
METIPAILGSKRYVSDNFIEIKNPFSGDVIARVSKINRELFERALDEAFRSERIMAELPSYKKAEILEKVSDMLLKNKDELSKLITLENGKPISESRIEVERAALTFKIASEEASRLNGEFLRLDRNPLSEKRWGIVRRFPSGTVLGITPFNFPLNLVAHKIAPAIASGNPVIIKPSSKTPLTAIRLGELLIEAGIPEGCLSILPCSSEIVEEFIFDSRIKVLSFTGSASAGWRLKKIAFNKKVLLELGGNAGVMIDRDCNLEFAIRRCVKGAFSYSGQICISVQRIYIHEDIYDDFVKGFVEAVSFLKIGDPLDETIHIGPLIDEENAIRIENWVNEALRNGAKLLTGGRRKGNFYEPTVITDVSSDMKIVCEEVFGPVVTLTRVKSFEEGIRAINDSAYGLQAGVFTEDIQKAFFAFEHLEVGGVIINDVPLYRVDHMPYGGVKMSGFGREGVRYAIEEMTELRLMVINLKKN